ncbi:MAG: metallophosphoesterase [Planctomycetota bacterium]|nr:metallophosphoesterase [Planctomycetota bacterium]
MRTIAHISDLHFGTDDPPVAEGLLVELATHPADLLVVSGDLTQRARRREFQAARQYLDRIKSPRIVVPGNHDLPLYNFLQRFSRPLRRYHDHIEKNLHPSFVDDEIGVVGVNTARSNTWKDGRISLAQINRMREQFDAMPRDVFKILVAHHPFIPPKLDPQAALVGRGPLALKTLAACGCSLILAGHLHHAYSGDVGAHHVEVKRSILVAQAGTAISRRRRDEANAYNRITIDNELLQLEVRGWNGTEFETATVETFAKHDNGWRLVREQ